MLKQLFNWHGQTLEIIQKHTGLTNYQIFWIAFAEGLFFGLNGEGKLHYRGRLDDAKMGTGDNRQPELLEAMIKVAETGQGPEHQIPSMGCSIKWK